MSKQYEPVKNFLAQLREAAKPDHISAMDAYINERLMRYLGSPDMLSMLYEIRFSMELGYDGLMDTLLPEKVTEIFEALEPILSSLIENQKFIVLREYSHTNRRQLWSVESRHINSEMRAIDWSNYMDSESKGKRKHFVAAVLSEPDE